MKTSDEKLIDKRMDEILISYSFYDLLKLVLEFYNDELEDYDDIDLLVTHICSQIDYNIFSVEYCDGICDSLHIIQNSCGLLSISDLLSGWEFDDEKFMKNLLVPFCRDKQLDILLDYQEKE
jgi:hypothetical protein